MLTSFLYALILHSLVSAGSYFQSSKIAGPLAVGASTRIMSYDLILMEEKETLHFIHGKLAELLDSWLPLMRLPRPLFEVLRYECTGMPPDDERRRGVTSLE